MQMPRDAVLLRIFMGESDRAGSRPLYEAVVMKARESGLAGATVLRGPMGFGLSSHLHTAKILRLSDDLPLIIEIVDSQEKIDAFLPQLDALMGAASGLVTLEKVQVLQSGYILHDRLLRPALVGVAKGSSGGGPRSEAEAAEEES